MNWHKNVHSFRPPSRDPRQISERCLVCEKPPKRFIFAQMTVGLEEYFERIRNGDGNEKTNLLENEKINEEVFTPSQGSILAGRYKVIAKVGEGQSSILVKAKDTFHPEKRHVAIKILHASYRNLGPQEASCLLHLKKADTLKVANIAHVLNIFAVGQHFCIVFEFLSPTPLYKYFQMFPFSSKADKINLIRRIASQVTQCLAVLSSLNIIHADIKPENILFANGKNRDVKIIDFGNAIYWVHDEMSLYFGSFELQTVFYRAPEVMFGLPFGPQIDMWSLGCVLAELYLGEPLFLATSKDEIIEKMQALLGPFPMVPFQSGKYFSTFKKFVGRTSTVPGYSKNVVNILKKLGSTDYMFADFLARLLTFDPRLRLSPVEAVRHPFLALECPLGFILPPGDPIQESSYSRILLTPATYPFRPRIDEKIKQHHYSELDLLHVGTQANTLGKNVAENVMKVQPFNYQEESTLIRDGQECIAENKSKTEANGACKTVENYGLRKDESPVVCGVSSGLSTFPATQEHRDNAFKESCSVLHATKDRHSFSSSVKKDAYGKSCSVLNRIKDPRSVASSVNEGQSDVFKEPHSLSSSTNDTSHTRFVKQDRDNAFNESCSVINMMKDPRSVAGSMNEGQKDAFNEPYSLSSSTNDTSSTRFVKQDRDNAFNESCSVINMMKDPRSVAGSMNEGQKDAFNEPYSLSSSTNDTSPTRFVKQDRDNAFNESCSVINITTDPRSVAGSMNEGQKDAFNEPCSLSSSTKDNRKDNAFNESCSVINTLKSRGFSKSESYKKRRRKKKRVLGLVSRKSSKIRQRRHEGEEIETMSSVSTDDICEDNKDYGKSYFARNRSPAKFYDVLLVDVPGPENITRTTSKEFDGKKADHNTTFTDDKFTRGNDAAKESKAESTKIAQLSFDTEEDEKHTTKWKGHTRPGPTAQSKTGADQPLFMPLMDECGDQIEITSESGNQKNIINSETGDQEIVFIEYGHQENIINETGNQRKSTEDTMKSNITENERTVERRPISKSRKHKKDTSNSNVVTSAVGRRKNESTKKVRSSKLKEDSQRKPKLSTTILRKDVTATSNRDNYQDERTSNSQGELNFFKTNEVSSSPNASTAGSKYEETVTTNPHLLTKKFKRPTSTKSSDLQPFSDDEYSFTADETVKKPMSTKTKKCMSKKSSIESFFDNWDDFPDDDGSLVSSGSKLRTKKPMPTKSQSFSVGRNRSSGGESKLVTHSKKPDRLPANNNGKKTMSAKSSNFKSFSEDGEASSGKELKLITSSVKQDNKRNNDMPASVGIRREAKREARTPNVQRKESVFDTPASVVTSTCELLPGGLSEVKKAICPSEQNQFNLNALHEIHNIFQASKRNDKTSVKTRKANTSPREKTGKVSSGRNTRNDEDKRGQVFRNESQDSQIFANEKPSTNSKIFPTDILTQDLVKPPRKRKLSYGTVNSPDHENMSCLRKRNAAKIQKLSDVELDDESFHEVVLSEDDSEKPSRSKNDEYIQKRDIAKKKKCAIRDFSHPIAKNTFQRFAEDDWSVEDCLCKNDSLSSIKDTHEEILDVLLL